MTNADNPLTRVYDKIWDLFEAIPAFNEFFKDGNKIKFNSATDRNPQKQNIATDDLPECMLLTEGMEPNIFDSSSSSKIIQNYSLVVHTGDFRLHEYALKINWIAIVALKDWKSTLGALQWRGENFVKVVRIPSVVIGQSEGQRQRGISGWGEIFRISVEMHFKTSNIVVSEE